MSFCIVFKFIGYLFYYSVNITKNFFISESQNGKACFLEVFITFCSLFRLFTFKMIPSVNFNNDLVLQTDKVWNIAIDRMLSAEMYPQFII